MKVTRNNQLDLKQTTIASTKQWIHDHGSDVADSIDRFFTTQAGSR